jgi:hypothetical protein
MFGVLVVVLGRNPIAGLEFSLGQRVFRPGAVG